MRSVIDRNVVIKRIPVFYIMNHTFKQKLVAGESALFHCIGKIPAFGDRCRRPSFRLVYLHVVVTLSQHGAASRQFLLRHSCHSSCANILTFCHFY